MLEGFPRRLSTHSIGHTSFRKVIPRAPRKTLAIPEQRLPFMVSTLKSRPPRVLAGVQTAKTDFGTRIVERRISPYLRQCLQTTVEVIAKRQVSMQRAAVSDPFHHLLFVAFAKRTFALACVRVRSLKAADSGEFVTNVNALSKSA